MDRGLGGEDGFSGKTGLDDSDFPVEVFIRDNRTENIISFEHWHTCFEILYVLEGHARHFMEDRDHDIRQGDFILIRCGEVHGTVCRQSENTRIMVVKFMPSLVSEQYYRLSGSRYISAFLNSGRESIYRLNGEEKQIIQAFLRELYEDFYGKGSAYELLVKSGVYRLIAYCIRFGLIPVPNAAAGCDYEKLLEVLLYIENHFQANITLRQVSEMLHMNYSYTSRYFKRLTGRTFKQYLDYIRVCEADKLLETERHMFRVAEQCGFSSPQSFSRTYKRLRGHSPKVKKC